MTSESSSSERRIAAIVFPDLLVEAALGLGLDEESLLQKRKTSFGVISIPAALWESRESLLSAPGRKEPRLEAVSLRAEKLGVRPGQSLSEARAVSADFELKLVSSETVSKLLLTVVDVVQSFGTSVSMNHSAGASFSPGAAQEDLFEPRKLAPCVWIDVSGIAHLWDGERALALEIRERVRLLGHTVRVAIAPGPELARAIALYGPEREGGLLIVPREKTREMVQMLPLAALPLAASELQYFAKLGIFEVSELARLPKASLASRLGLRARSILDWLEGRDDTPLTPCALSETLEEKMEFEGETTDLSPVLFALRGLLARLCARLLGRGRAVSHFELGLELAAGFTAKRPARSLRLSFELSLPLSKEGDLFRVIKTRLERIQLEQAIQGLRLVADRFEETPALQLSLGKKAQSPHEALELSLLLGELGQDLGAGRVGVLSVEESHKPEERSRLKPLFGPKQKTRGPRRAVPSEQWKTELLRTRELDRVTRLLPEPIPLSIPLRVGSSVLLAKELYTLKRLKFIERLDGVSWWEKSGVHRDYLWALFQGPEAVLETLVYVDRRTGERFLQGLCD